MLVALMAMLPGFTAGAKSYNIWIGGVQVTDENKSNIKSDAIIKGKVWYNSQSNELWLDNAEIKTTASQGYGIQITMDMTVRTISNVFVTGVKIVPVLIENGATVTFLDSRLFLETEGVAGLYLRGGKMKAVNTYITSQGKWGIAGNVGDVETVDLDWSCLNLKGTEAACTDLLSLTLKDCRMPVGVTYDLEGKNLVRDGKPVKEAVISETIKLRVCENNVSLRETNRSIGNGGYYFDNTTRTLLLRDLDWNSPSGKCVDSEVSGLKITTKGKCNVNSKSGFFLAGSTIFEDVNINLTSDLLGIYLYSSPVTIKNSEITINSKEWGIAGELFQDDRLNIADSDLKVSGSTAAIAEVTGFSLSGCKIVSPSDAVYNSGTGYVESGGKIVNNLEIASPVYNLTIDGVQVKGSNCSNFRLPGLENGEIHYYPSYNLLTLKDVVLKSDYGIKNGIKDLTIQCLGDVYIETNSGIISTTDFEIRGPGVNSAKLVMSTPGSCGIFMHKNMSINDMTLEVSGRWGIAGVNGSSEELTISGCNIKASGTDGSICAVKTLTLNDCCITAPENAAFDAVLHGIALNGALVTEAVEIKKGAGVEGVIAEQAEDLNAPMFNVMGQQIKEPYNGQIYIQNGRKKVWRE